MAEPVLYDYVNSTAAYRVRIALNLKRIAYRTAIVNLVDKAHRAPDFLARNPQGLLPVLSIDGHDLSQSLAIIDYLDRAYPEPRLIPEAAGPRAATLSHAMVIIADVHPVNNLRVWQYLKDPFGHSQDDVVQWMHHWMALGFAALEAAAPDQGPFGGDAANLVNICLVAQFHNARRFGLDLAPYPRLVGIVDALADHPAYAAAHPDRLADAAG